MGLELRHLRYLLAVAERGNFSRAAEDLHVSQPTLSQQVKQLERIVGVQLLDRTGRSVRLTDAGETYVHYARRALRDLAAAERAVLDVADLSRGSLRLGVTPTFIAYLIGPLTAGLHARHPGIVLDVKEMTQDDIESKLLADELDLGITFEGSHLPGISVTALFDETLSLVVGVHRPDVGHRRRMPVRELAERRLALLSGDFATRGHIDAYFARHGVSPRIVVEANSIQALTEIVQHSTVATVLPDAIADDHPNLSPIPLEPSLPARTVALVRRESAYHSAAARAFTRIIEDVIRARGYTTA